MQGVRSVQEKKASPKPLFLVAMTIFAAVVVLGLFRFHASQLEYLLNSINRNIERYSMEEMELKQVFSGLSSTFKIYNYCRDRLHMDKAENVEMLRLTSPRATVSVPAVESKKSWRSSLFSFFGLTAN
jgi:hypothetical protein